MFRRAEIRLASFLLALVATAGLLHGPAQAQFRGGYAFLQAVDSRDGTKATDALKDDPSLINFTDGAEELLDEKAPVDQTNRRGETALILAVQAKNSAMVRLLVKRGANPDKTDHVAGMSARAYAKRDDRSGQLVALLDAKPDGAMRDNSAVFGPK